MSGQTAGARGILPSGERDSGKPESKVSPWVASHSFKHDRKLGTQHATLHTHECVTLIKRN